MNNYFRTLLILTCLPFSLHAKLGCMDNSKHLSESLDSKQYEYVQCNCPCEKQYQQYTYRGYKCTKCHHAHDPMPWIITTGQVSKTAVEKKEEKPLQNLVRKFRVASNKRNK